MSKHTPGPWKHRGRMTSVERAGDTPVMVWSGEVYPPKFFWSNCFIQSSQHLDGGLTHAEAEANARLIAASPDLLDALERIAALDDDNANAYLAETGSYAMFDEPGSVMIARAAITKAKGERS